MSTFPELKIGEHGERFEVWKMLLSDLSDAEFLRGITKFCRFHEEIYPNTNVAAYIRKYGREDLTVPTPEEGWEEVREQMSRVGYYNSPSWTHPLIARAVKAVGWRDLCVSEQPDISRAHFLRVYKAFQERAQTDRLSEGTE